MVVHILLIFQAVYLHKKLQNEAQDNLYKLKQV